MTKSRCKNSTKMILRLLNSQRSRTLAMSAARDALSRRVAGVASCRADMPPRAEKATARRELSCAPLTAPEAIPTVRLSGGISRADADIIADAAPPALPAVWPPPE